MWNIPSKSPRPLSPRPGNNIFTAIRQRRNVRWSPLMKVLAFGSFPPQIFGDLSKSYIASEFGYYVSNPYQWGSMKDCISLKRISLPSKLEFYSSAGESFSGCKSLESIFIVGNEFPEPYKNCGRGYDKDGVLFVEKGDHNVLIKYPANKGTEYTIPNNISEIGNCAFEDCHLSRLTMPTVPPTCKENAFKGVNIIALTLVVPKGSHNSYWLHPVFGKFNIEEMDE